MYKRQTLIEMNRILQVHERRFVEPVAQSLIDDGVNILENTFVNWIEKEKNDIKLHLSSGEVFMVSDLLIAAGRVPNIEHLALEKAEVEYDEFGVKVDKNLRTTNRSVYAIGDIVEGSRFTHTASYHAGIVLKKILLGLPSKLRTNHIPRVTYTCLLYTSPSPRD